MIFDVKYTTKSTSFWDLQVILFSLERQDALVGVICKFLNSINSKITREVLKIKLCALKSWGIVPYDCIRIHANLL